MPPSSDRELKQKSDVINRINIEKVVNEAQKESAREF
jgi:hypothetical protein